MVCEPPHLLTTLSRPIMKNTLFSDGLAVVSLITAGLTLTANAKIQAHGHQHGDIFDRIMHKSTASSGSSFNITTLGTADSRSPTTLLDLGISTDCPSRLHRPTPHSYWHWFCAWLLWRGLLSYECNSLLSSFHASDTCPPITAPTLRNPSWPFGCPSEPSSKPLSCLASLRQE